MPNVSFTDPMEEYIRMQIKSGAYANVSEVVRAGMRLLMEKDGARQYYALKAELEAAVADAENGATYDADSVFEWMDGWGTDQETPLAKIDLHTVKAKR